MSRGAYLKTETGKPLAEIVQVDPALVSFAHPYDSLLELHHVAPERIEEYLDRFAVHVALPTGERYEQTGKVAFVGTELNSDGALQVWAEIPNPEVILIPGLQVSVSIELKKYIVQRFPLRFYRPTSLRNIRKSRSFAAETAARPNVEDGLSWHLRRDLRRGPV